MRRAALALALAVAALAALGAAAAGASIPARSVPAAVRAASVARAPFRGLTATSIHVGGQQLQVVVAQTEPERELGLRRRSNLGPYDGMLFVFQGDTTVAFTMSTVPVPLDIAFYARSGRVVDRLVMEPCPHAEDECPVYESSGPFRYALETLVGGLPRGALTG